MSWYNLLSRRSAVQTVLGMFAGASSVASAAGAAQLILPQGPRPVDADRLRQFGEKAELFKSLEVGFIHNFQTIADHHSKKSADPQACLSSLKKIYTSEKKQQLFNDCKNHFAQTAAASLTPQEHELFSKIMSFGESEVSALMGKIFDARRQTLEVAFKNLDADMDHMSRTLKTSEET